MATERLVRYWRQLTLGEFRTLPDELKKEYLDFLFDAFISIAKVIQFTGYEQGVLFKIMGDLRYTAKRLTDEGVEEQLEERIRQENELVGEPKQTLRVDLYGLMKIHKEKRMGTYSNLILALIPVLARKQRTPIEKETMKMNEEQKVIVEEQEAVAEEQSAARPKTAVVATEAEKESAAGKSEAITKRGGRPRKKRETPGEQKPTTKAKRGRKPRKAEPAETETGGGWLFDEESSSAVESRKAETEAAEVNPADESQTVESESGKTATASITLKGEPARILAAFSAMAEFADVVKYLYLDLDPPKP